MNTARYLLHLMRLHWHRLNARDALDCLERARAQEIISRERMERANAREEEEQRAWKRWNEQVRQCAD